MITKFKLFEALEDELIINLGDLYREFGDKENVLLDKLKQIISSFSQQFSQPIAIYLYPIKDENKIVEILFPDLMTIDYNDKENISDNRCILFFCKLIYKGRNNKTPKYLRFSSFENYSIRLVLDKRKKIEYPDIDPYGEEDWGYIENDN